MRSIPLDFSCCDAQAFPSGNMVSTCCTCNVAVGADQRAAARTAHAQPSGCEADFHSAMQRFETRRP
jgi:hypothetical protein